MELTIDKPQYGRSKGSPWFNELYKKDILLLGQGGIGSWVALALSRIGVNLYTFDMDYYEEHNMSGQLVRTQDIDKLKTQATREILLEFSPDCEVETSGEYTASSYTSEIVICGFDNMKARKLAFDNWERNLTDDNRIHSFFMDGRLNPEDFQIFCISGNRQDLIDLYKEKYLFDDANVAEAECTFKQTTHSAMMIAGHMVAFLTNWGFNQTKQGRSVRTIPFKFVYVTSINLIQTDGRL